MEDRKSGCTPHNNQSEACTDFIISTKENTSTIWLVAKSSL